MTKEYQESFVEVVEVLNHSSPSVLEKIPTRLIDLFNTNKSEEYVARIDFLSENWEDGLMPNTQAILALLYRDFLTSPEERKHLIDKEKEARLYSETLGIAQADTNGMFNSSPIITGEDIELSNNTTTQLIEMPKEPWYKKIYHKTLDLFKFKY
ncbi:MAG: hypothetical protein IKL68_01310 [Clostridia bacterium]|nr:hypothetical protein [Clostridia bacterium]